jgi:hypothetical protein
MKKEKVQSRAWVWRKEKGEERKGKRKKRRKENRKNKLSIFRICDL